MTREEQGMSRIGIDWDVVRTAIDGADWIDAQGWEPARSWNADGARRECRYYRLGTLHEMLRIDDREPRECDACAEAEVPCSPDVPCTGSSGEPIGGTGHCIACREAAFWGVLDGEAEAASLTVELAHDAPATQHSSVYAVQYRRLTVETLRQKHGAVADQLVDLLGGLEEAADAFYNLYVGQYPTLAEWAAEALYREYKFDDTVEPYIDFAGYANDRLAEGAILKFEADGKVHVFNAP